VTRARKPLTHDYLVSDVLYDAVAGEFYRRATGKMLGTPDKYGYTVVWCGDKAHFAHRLAWFYVYGAWPEGHVHHKNGIKTDNSIVNLEDLDSAEHLLHHPSTVERRKRKWKPKFTLLKTPSVLMRILAVMGFELGRWSGTSKRPYQIVSTSTKEPVARRMTLDEVDAWVQAEQERRCASDVSLPSSMVRLAVKGGRSLRERKGIIYSRVESAGNWASRK